MGQKAKGTNKLQPWGEKIIHGGSGDILHIREVERDVFVLIGPKVPAIR